MNMEERIRNLICDIEEKLNRMPGKPSGISGGDMLGKELLYAGAKFKEGKRGFTKKRR